MYAIIATGGKQYTVSEGDVIKVEKLGVNAGDTVTFDQVLFVNNGELPICFTHFNIKLTQVKTPILNDFTPLTPSATKVPNLPTNIPSVYAGFQNHNN